MTVEDFFAQDGPVRDRWDRPMLVPASSLEEHRLEGCSAEDTCRHRRAYTRSSTLSDYLADFSHIWKWKMRYLARELGRDGNRDLRLLAGCEPYTTGFDKGDEKENRASGRRLDDVIERALDRGKISERADFGTVVHALTEPGNDGDIDDPDASAARDSWWAKLEELGIKLLGTELFTACDDLTTSGTFDHLAYVPGLGIIIVDKKTSREIHGCDFRIQLATYANADLYDWQTDRRLTLAEYCILNGWDAKLLNREVGLIAWINKNPKTDVWSTTFHKLDLVAGLDAAHRAAWVRDNHRKGKHSWPWDNDIRKHHESELGVLENLIIYAESREELARHHRENRHLWTQAHTDMAKTRLAGLEGSSA